MSPGRQRRMVCVGVARIVLLTVARLRRHAELGRINQLGGLTPKPTRIWRRARRIARASISELQAVVVAKFEVADRRSRRGDRRLAPDEAVPAPEALAAAALEFGCSRRVPAPRTARPSPAEGRAPTPRQWVTRWSAGPRRRCAISPGLTERRDGGPRRPAAHDAASGSRGW